MGFVPEDDSHCKVRSLPSVSSPSNSHLGFDGLTGKKKKKDPQTPDSVEELHPVDLFFHPYGQLLSVDSIVLCYLAMLYTTLQNIPISIPCIHIHPIPAVSSGAVVIFRGCLRNSLITSQRRETFIIGNFRKVECDFTNTETGIEVH